MTEFDDCDDYTPFDAIESKICEKLWEINDEVAKLHSLVESFYKLGIPVQEQPTLEREINKMFGSFQLYSIHDISEASLAAATAAKAAAKSAAG